MSKAKLICLNCKTYVFVDIYDLYEEQKIYCFVCAEDLIESIDYQCCLGHKEEHFFTVGKSPDHIVCNACVFDSEDINYAFPIDKQSIRAIIRG